MFGQLRGSEFCFNSGLQAVAVQFGMLQGFGRDGNRQTLKHFLHPLPPSASRTPDRIEPACSATALKSRVLRGVSHQASSSLYTVTVVIQLSGFRS